MKNKINDHTAAALCLSIRKLLAVVEKHHDTAEMHRGCETCEVALFAAMLAGGVQFVIESQVP